MRKSIKEFVKICAEILPISEPIYEFGSLQVPGQEGFADLRPFFQNKKYIGADMQKGAGVDVILNLHNINLPSESIGTVLMLDTLEHVEFPRKAIREVHRILKPDGVIIISSVMNFHIHDYPFDYWRFTPEAFKSLLKPFFHCYISYAGEKNFPHTVIGIGFKSGIEKEKLDNLELGLNAWKKYWSNPVRNWQGRKIGLLMPPLFLAVYRKMKQKLLK
jgi:SAM-dependent methyltransferase